MTDFLKRVMRTLVFSGNHFLEEVKPAFTFLAEDRGFELVYEEVADSFDNGQLIYENPRIRILVVRDRGDVWYTVRARRDHREFSDGYVRLLLTGADEWRTTAAQRLEKDGGARFLSENLDAIEALFAPERLEETCRRGKRLQDSYVEKAWGLKRKAP